MSANALNAITTGLLSNRNLPIAYSFSPNHLPALTIAPNAATIPSTAELNIFLTASQLVTIPYIVPTNTPTAPPMGPNIRPTPPNDAAFPAISAAAPVFSYPRSFNASPAILNPVPTIPNPRPPPNLPNALLPIPPILCKVARPLVPTGGNIDDNRGILKLPPIAAQRPVVFIFGILPDAKNPLPPTFFNNTSAVNAAENIVTAVVNAATATLNKLAALLCICAASLSSCAVTLSAVSGAFAIFSASSSGIPTVFSNCIR